MWFGWIFLQLFNKAMRKKSKERMSENIEYKYMKSEKNRLQIQKNSCKTSMSKCGKWFFAFLTDIEKSIEWMRKSVEWGIQNYHYELKIGIAEKKSSFIRNLTTEREKSSIFPPFLSPLLPFIHSASALLIIMMPLMLRNVSVYPCYRYIEMERKTHISKYVEYGILISYPSSSFK